MPFAGGEGGGAASATAGVPKMKESHVRCGGAVPLVVFSRPALVALPGLGESREGRPRAARKKVAARSGGMIKRRSSPTRSVHPERIKKSGRSEKSDMNRK